ncbi:hypothetical protein [Sphingomonas rubra]|uniref:Glycerophosphoryl diester phosphodiesterase membrane domain-containing protein n=1 Tax=Sphingomonas rubra TaxID=634430 RepID=A0A1I5UHK4_9SPHN|nr:hypothetical protein [Sphingomonas rubra]SFP94086.1 hypothetical protein SAMN04488241_111147 [Sphingomonas rubra]
MVSVGQVWDRTVDVLRGRTAIIAPIAALAIFLPSVVNAALASYGPRAVPAAGLLVLAVALAVVVATVWGTLAIIAVATDPATTRADAQAQASARVLPAIGIVVALGVALSLAFVPIFVALVRGGVNVTLPSTAVKLSGGAATFVTLYTLVLIVAGLWLSARLMLLNPVILNERLGLRSVLRSVELTRGLTWRLIGVLVLFALVVLVPTLAARSVVGLVVRLLLGADGIPTAAFLAGVAAAAVSTVFSAVAAVFQAQLYVAARAARDPL